LAKNILAPVDGSNFMERNVKYACEMAKNMGSRLTLIHVVTVPAPIQAWSPSVAPEFPSELGHLKKPLEDAALDILDRAQHIARKHGVDSDTRLQTTYGNPAQAIIKFAEEHKSDLIVIGAKGHSLLRNLTVGSVCDTIVHNAPCAVFVVR